ncbi:hypothetical protein KIPB_016752, partial [Kipferlia bialata]|eukprot:g16752.t1
MVVYLNLSDNCIGDTGAVALSEALSSLIQLTGLALHNNMIGDTGATALAQSISSLTQLTE